MLRTISRERGDRDVAAWRLPQRGQPAGPGCPSDPRLEQMMLVDANGLHQIGWPMLVGSATSSNFDIWVIQPGLSQMWDDAQTIPPGDAALRQGARGYVAAAAFAAVGSSLDFGSQGNRIC